MIKEPTIPGPAVEKPVYKRGLQSYYNQTAHFNEKGDLYLHVEEYDENGESAHEEETSVLMTKENYDALNADRGDEIIGEPRTLYLCYSKKSPKNQIITSKPESSDFTQFSVSLTKLGNPVVKIDKPVDFTFDANGNYNAKISSGVITPEVALKDGLPGHYLRKQLITLAKNEEYKE